MKKVLAVLLALTMLLPMCLVAQADTVTTKPFYMVNWSEPEGNVKYIYGMPWSWVNGANIKANSTDADNAPVSVGGSETDVAAAAKQMYEMLSKCPAGARYFNFAAQRTLFLTHCKDLVDMRHGVELTKNWLTALLTAYKALGGELDGIILDLEYNDATVYYINANYYSNKTKPNKNIYNEIANNEYYKTVLRPILVERGFVFYENPDPVKYPYRSELWTIENCSEDGAVAISQSIWNQVIQENQAKAMTKAVYEPLIQFYPNAVVSDYKTSDSDSWYKGMNHTGGQFEYNSIKAGNVSNYNFYDYATGYLFYGYGSETNRTKRTKYQKPASYNDAYFADAPYSRTNWEVNTMKRLLASTDTGKVNAWITFFNYGTYGPGYSRTPYYSELIYHLGMTNPEPFVGYITKQDVLNKGYDDPQPDVCEYDYNLKVVDELMAELTRVAGASDRKAIITPITWNEGFFYSGMYAGGRNIWRLTPDTNAISVENFKVKDKAPTFRVNGVTITFPQGRIITDSKITHVGTCGYWIETPADVTPVITSTADRYEKDPSFYDAFDYPLGVFNSDSVLPNTFWTVSGTAFVVENGGNRTVSLANGAKLTNTKVPNLITAGDYYAKQQIWEVKVTLPDGDYGNVVLLSGGSKDGGVKIAGGKVYYDQAGTYREMSGVTLNAGVYTVKRELDFRTENNYTCSYTIYNASGNRIGGTERVKLAELTIPVTQITLSASGGKAAVMLDDYKLYPTGVTTNLDLYDAKSGRKVADPAVPMPIDTAYRLSWMNATDKYMTAYIYDSVSGVILKWVDMAPGMDGVVVGVIEASTGYPVRVAVATDEISAPVLPDYDKGKFGWTAASEGIGLATGPKPAEAPDPTPDKPGGGNNDTPAVKPDGGNADTPNTPNMPNTPNTPNENPGNDQKPEGEEGDNVSDIIGGNPETTPESTPGTTPGTNKPAGDGNNAGNAATDAENKETTIGEDKNAAAEEPTDGKSNAADNKKKSKGLSGGEIALLVCLIVVALAGGGIAVFLFIRSKQVVPSGEEEPMNDQEANQEDTSKDNPEDNLF